MASVSIAGSSLFASTVKGLAYLAAYFLHPFANLYIEIILA